MSDTGIKVSEFYQREARILTDMLFDKRFLNDSLSRESIDWLQDYLGFVLQSKCDMAAKGATLLARMRDKQE